jgi:hypothetical protein
MKVVKKRQLGKRSQFENLSVGLKTTQWVLHPALLRPSPASHRFSIRYEA